MSCDSRESWRNCPHISYKIEDQVDLDTGISRHQHGSALYWGGGGGVCVRGDRGGGERESGAF